MRRFGIALVLMTLLALGSRGVVLAQEPTSGPVVEVVDPGAEPRAALRLAPASGSTSTQVITMTQSLRQSGASSASFGPVGLRQVTENTVGTIGADGSFHLTQTISSMKVLASTDLDRATRRRIDKNLRALRDVKVAATMTNTGAVIESSSDIPSGLDPDVRQLMTQFQDQAADLATPLPTEPVGVGARWKVTQHLTLYGIDVVQTSTYTLQSRSGNVLELDVELRQTARPQAADLPGVPSDVDVRITRWRASQHGHYTHDLTRPYPLRVKTRLSGLQVFRADDGDHVETIRQRLSVKIAAKPG